MLEKKRCEEKGQAFFRLGLLVRGKRGGHIADETKLNMPVFFSLSHAPISSRIITFRNTVFLGIAWAVFFSMSHAAVTSTNYDMSGNPAVSTNSPNNVAVTPKGVYAAINTKPIQAVMLKLKNTVGHENDDLINDIEQHSGKYAPPVFFALADLLYRQNNLPDAIFWFNAGRFRADFDAARCADVSARDAVSILVLGIPVELRKAQFNDVNQLRTIVQKVIQWDEVTPYDYEYRWINLHGMNAMRSGLGQSEADTEPLTLPLSTWPDLAKKNRDDYAKSLEDAIAAVQQHRLQNTTVPATAPAGLAGPSTIPDTPVNRMLGITGPNQPLPREQIINLGVGENFQVKDLAFSPDGQYLAIFGALDDAHELLAIWDLKAKRDIARITDIGAGFAKNPRLTILWAHDDSFVTLGMSFNNHPGDPSSPWQMRLWNPLTGTKIQDVDVQAWYAALNRDGTELLTAAGSKNRAAYRIYDTRTWMYWEYPGNEILYSKGTLAWTAQDHVFAAGPWYGAPVLPDLQPTDVLARVIDPSGQETVQTIVLTSSKDATSPTSGRIETFEPRYSAIDEVGNKIAVGWGTIKVLSGDPLRVLYTYTPPDVAGFAEGKFIFSPNGKYLFVMSKKSATQSESVILNAETGRQVGKFPAGTGGLAISPDNHWLALGDGYAIKILAMPGNGTK
jgi:WD40 repeat protein